MTTTQRGIRKLSEDFQVRGEVEGYGAVLTVELNAFGDKQTIIYQTGVSYIGGDINHPSKELEIDDAAGTSEAIAMVASDISQDRMTERMGKAPDIVDQDFVYEISEISPNLNTIKRVEALKDFLVKNQPNILDFMSEEDVSDMWV